MMQPVYEKMSKSRGNVVLPEEVVYGVAELTIGYEFRFPNGEIADWEKLGIWQNNLQDHCFYTATRYGRQPVFFHYSDNVCPPLIEFKELISPKSGEFANASEFMALCRWITHTTIQHPQLRSYWQWWLEWMEKHGWDSDEAVYKAIKVLLGA